jgi:quercetin dioxygenase-like cupin family protein
MSCLGRVPVAAVVFAGLLTFLSASAASAQQSAPGAKRTVPEEQDLSVPGYEGVLVRTELIPGAHEPKHTHPGDIFGYVMEGTVTLIQEGLPTVRLVPGGAFFVPAGRVHGASNEGTTTVELLVTVFVEKGKSLTSPVQ